MTTFYRTVDGQQFDDYEQAKTWEEKLKTFSLTDFDGQPTLNADLARYVYCPTITSIANFNTTIGKRMGIELPCSAEGCGVSSLEDGEGVIPTLILPQSLIEEMMAK